MEFACSASLLEAQFLPVPLFAYLSKVGHVPRLVGLRGTHNKYSD